MATEQRQLTFLGDYDDFPNDLSLRIPPLQDPMPYTVSSRLSPLEPNARVNTGVHNPSAALTSRRKALAEAKSIGEPDGLQTQPGKDRSVDLHAKGSGSAPPRKRQKLHSHERAAEFVQLPKPKAKLQDEKPPPFHPISVLNELHEPPPSAALFPPITPNSLRHGEDILLLDRPSHAEGNVGQGSSKKGFTDGRGKGYSGKRLNLRPRQKWTERETHELLEGIKIYGLGKWKKVLHHASFSFHPERTAVDLKDRYRTCVASRKVIETLSLGPPFGGKTLLRTEYAVPSTAIAFTPVSLPPPKARPPKSRKPLDDTPRPLVARRKPKTHWTNEEDTNLANGYRKHGFQWTAIAKDPELSLAHRTGPQIRDRFRIKHPEIYKQSGPMPLLEVSSDVSKPITIENENGTSDSLKRPSKPAKINTRNQTPEADAEEPERNHDENDLSQHSVDDASHPVPAPPALGGILGLLNDEDEEISRLPSFKYPYDDDWGGDSVTLPPLLWEDMATRPMFDLE